MKKLLFSFSLILACTMSMQAQESAGKLAKAATKALGSYLLTPEKSEKLTEAKEKVDLAIAAFETAEDKEKSRIYLTKGEVYNELAARDLMAKDKDPTFKHVDNHAIDAMEAFKMAKDVAQKKFETKDALSGLLESASYMQNIGANMYDAKDFGNAFKAFQGVLAADEVLKAAGNKSTLETDEALNNLRYAAGLSALNANMLEDAGPIFQQLYDAKFDEPSVYEALYKIKSKDSPEEAVAILNAGREKYPDDVALLFAEINDYLIKGKLDELVGKLELAIEKEPENKSLYSTLGNVYDNLFQRELEAGNETEANNYFDKSLGYYNQALEKDPKFSEAIYSVGALYYNKAASITKKMKSLEDDYSKEGTKKYDALKADMVAQFDMALPFFQKAEGLNPNDISTLTALKEIYARKDDLEKSGEFKTRIDKAAAGEKNEPYFKN